MEGAVELVRAGRAAADRDGPVVVPARHPREMLADAGPLNGPPLRDSVGGHGTERRTDLWPRAEGAALAHADPRAEHGRTGAAIAARHRACARAARGRPRSDAERRASAPGARGRGTQRREAGDPGTGAMADELRNRARRVSI